MKSIVSVILFLFSLEAFAFNYIKLNIPMPIKVYGKEENIKNKYLDKEITVISTKGVFKTKTSTKAIKQITDADIEGSEYFPPERFWEIHFDKSKIEGESLVVIFDDIDIKLLAPFNFKKTKIYNGKYLKSPNNLVDITGKDSDLILKTENINGKNISYLELYKDANFNILKGMQGGPSLDGIVYYHYDEKENIYYPLSNLWPLHGVYLINDKKVVLEFKDMDHLYDEAIFHILPNNKAKDLTRYKD